MKKLAQLVLATGLLTTLALPQHRA